MGLIQRGLDEGGLCTISITQVVEITAIVKPSRAIFVAHPFGLTFGAVGDAETQHALFDALLSAAVDMEAPGIRDTGFIWRQDDLRADNSASSVIDSSRRRPLAYRQAPAEFGRALVICLYQAASNSRARRRPVSVSYRPCTASTVVPCSLSVATYTVSPMLTGLNRIAPPRLSCDRTAPVAGSMTFRSPASVPT